MKKSYVDLVALREGLDVLEDVAPPLLEKLRGGAILAQDAGGPCPPCIETVTETAHDALAISSLLADVGQVLIDTANKMEILAKSRHVDAFIVDRNSDPYAAFVLDFFRRSAAQHARFGRFMASHRLYCTHEGKRYRVTGASRLGDIWLTSNFTQDAGYELRVGVDTCSAWGASP